MNITYIHGCDITRKLVCWYASIKFVGAKISVYHEKYHLVSGDNN